MLRKEKCILCSRKTEHLYNNLFDDRYGASGFYSVYQCKKCGFGRTVPPLEKKAIGKFYKKYYPLSVTSARSIKNSVGTPSNFMAWLMGTDNIAHRHIKAGKKVLDIGSGTGRSLMEIKRLGSVGFGVEPDPNAQKLAKKLMLNVFKGFITDNPFPKEKFDYVTGSQVVEHEPDPVKFLLAATKKLNKDGQLILSFPNFDSIYRKIFGRKWINWHIPYHINFFTKDSFEQLAKKTDLKIVSYKTITPNIWTVLQIRNVFSKSEMGKRGAMWETKPTSTLIKIINIILFMLAIPVNRTIDIIGLGDSVLVTLEKE